MTKPTITISGPAGSGKTLILSILAEALPRLDIPADFYDDGQLCQPRPVQSVSEHSRIRVSGINVVTEE